MKMIMTNPMFRNALIVVAPENNLAFEAINLENELSEHFSPKDYICFKDEKARTGIHTDNLLKRGMSESLKQDLDRGQVHFWEEFMSVEGHYKCKSADDRTKKAMRALAADGVRDELTNEIRNFLHVSRKPRDPTRPPTVQYTGKLYGGFDDMLMAFFMANTCRKLFFASEEYARYH